MATSLAQSSRWVSQPQDLQVVDLLTKELNLSRTVATVLAARGFSDPDSAYRFLNPSLADLHSPKLLPDYEPAMRAILQAKESGDLVYVHGDYDVDGVTSASMFARFLKSIGVNVHVHVPHRMKHGYGVHEAAVHDAQRLGAKLLLTCDCGVAAHDSIRLARELGIGVVVTDHHTVGETLPPDALAVVNPHRKDSQYPFKDLCGAGVAFKVCEGITEELGHKREQFQRAFLDLAALGTISDIMPLRDENRILTAFGLKQLSETRKPGLKALKEVSKLSSTVTAFDAGWKLGPRLNAAGRIEDAALSLRLLMTQDEKEAKELAITLDNINTERREEEKKIVEEAVARVEEERLHENPIIFLAGEGWHLGIVGLVAGRLVERFRRPTFVLNLDTEKGIAKGSGRSIEGYDLSHIIHAHPERFLSGGGHAMAAGCSVDITRLDEVRSLFEDYARETLSEEDYVKVRRYDCEVGPGELSLDDVQELALLEPTGAANPSPVFVARGLEVTANQLTKSGEHRMLRVKYPNHLPFKVNGWRMADSLAEVEPGDKIDVLFKPAINEWNGSMSVEWSIEDFRTV